ncbi:MAG: hypothetical protein ACOC8B_07625 [Gemmatimonadota bacterium]
MRSERTGAVAEVVVRVTVAVLAAAVVGCDGGVEDRFALVERIGVSDDGGGASVVPASSPSERDVAGGADAVAAPRRIYYDLTAFDWYRRGEPLLLAGAAYQPDGVPMSASAERMRRIDVHRGVDVYVPLDAVAPHEVVYVPVFRGYWQPFVRQVRDPRRAD